MWPLVGQAIWHGAIERLAMEAVDAVGGPLFSNLRRLTREWYPNLSVGGAESLVQYAAQAIYSANAYLGGQPNYTPLIRDLPDTRAVIRYAFGTDSDELQGTVRHIRYGISVITRVTDRRTGVETVRENKVLLRSGDPLSNEQLQERAAERIMQMFLFDWDTDRNLIRALESFETVSVSVGLGQPGEL